MPLNEETKDKVRAVYNRKFDDLPVAKDLPRLAKFITICDEDGKLLSYAEYETLNTEQYFTNGVLQTEIKLFLHIRRVLLTLMTVLEGEEQAIALDKLLITHIGDENFFLPEVLTKFMLTNLGDDSKIVKALKCANQASIAPPLIELKFALGADNTTKDVANSWRIIILITNEKNMRVINQKKEMCICNRFLIEWEFSVTLQDKMDRLEDIYLKILDISFSQDCTSKRIMELRNIIKKYTDNDFWNLTGNSKQFLMADESANFPSFMRLPGEILYKQFPNVILLYRPNINPISIEGTIFLTNFWINFIENEKSSGFQFSHQIPITNIAKINKRKDRGEVEIICKDIRAPRFIFQGKAFKSFLSSLQTAISIHFNRLFAVSHSRSIQLTRSETETSSESLSQSGWHLYSIENEMKRLKFDQNKWRISNINRYFQLCESYPSQIVVPKNITDAELLMSSQYRKNARLPVASWRHRNGSVLLHGSIPNHSFSADMKLTNLPAKEDDEKVIQAYILNTITIQSTPTVYEEKEELDAANNNNNNNNNSNISINNPLLMKRQSKRVLSGLRQRKSSIAFSSLRSGSTNNSIQQNNNQSSKSESTSFYIVELRQKTDLSKQRDFIESVDQEEFSGIVAIERASMYYDSFADLKESYRRIHKLCTSTPAMDDHWLSNVDNTRWLEHIHCLMLHSFQLVELLSNSFSVFLSCCEDHWDRGCQISSLAQVWMDPFYRTIKGFIILIEKEWISFGHRFADRSGYFTKEDGADVLPIFIQFLDCVWQSMQQFPSHFEFTNSFLIAIADSVYSGSYGTFISNNDSSRRSNLIRINTESFWTHVIDYHQYKNPFYVKLESTITPSFNQRSLILWSGFFLRWFEGDGTSSAILPRQPLSYTGQDILSPSSQIILNEKQTLQRYICTLEKTADIIMNEIKSQKEKLESLKNSNSYDYTLFPIKYLNYQLQNTPPPRSLFYSNSFITTTKPTSINDLINDNDKLTNNNANNNNANNTSPAPNSPILSNDNETNNLNSLLSKSLPLNSRIALNNNNNNNNNNNDNDSEVSIRSTWKSGSRTHPTKIRKSLVLNRDHLDSPKNDSQMVPLSPTAFNALKRNSNNDSSELFSPKLSSEDDSNDFYEEDSDE